MVTLATSQPSQSLFADRFISSRAIGAEFHNTYDAKSEIFQHSYLVNQIDKLGSHPQMPEENNENMQRDNGGNQTDEN